MQSKELQHIKNVDFFHNKLLIYLKKGIIF